MREGYRREHDRLPPRFMEEPISTGPSKGMAISRQMLDDMLDQYYEFRGWDKQTGKPMDQVTLTVPTGSEYLHATSDSNGLAFFRLMPGR